MASPSCVNSGGQWLSQSSFKAVEVLCVCVYAGVCLHVDLSISMFLVSVIALLMPLSVAHSLRRPI